MTKPSNVKDLSGLVFGKLTVLEYAGIVNGRHAWECECDCGTKKIIIGKNLTGGNTTSCGCYRSSMARQLGIKKSRKRKIGRTALSSFSDADEDV